VLCHFYEAILVSFNEKADRKECCERKDEDREGYRVVELKQQDTEEVTANPETSSPQDSSRGIGDEK
jgi:hypothetical protein